MTKYRGALIALEGIDRAGKTSLIRLLPKHLLGCKEKIVTCGEYQSPVKRLISRDLLSTLTPFVKAFLFAADRAWTYEKTCLPALRKGHIVLWDRYVDSAKAYRGAEIRRGGTVLTNDFVDDINRPFVVPDLTIFVDVPVTTSLKRSKKERSKSSYQAEFLQKVSVEYMRLHKLRGYAIVDGSRPKADVVKEVVHIIKKRLKRFF